MFRYNYLITVVILIFYSCNQEKRIVLGPDDLMQIGPCPKNPDICSEQWCYNKSKKALDGIVEFTSKGKMIAEMKLNNGTQEWMKAYLRRKDGDVLPRRNAVYSTTGQLLTEETYAYKIDNSLKNLASLKRTYPDLKTCEASREERAMYTGNDKKLLARYVMENGSFTYYDGSGKIIDQALFDSLLLPYKEN
jgi:hypothetical protein